MDCWANDESMFISRRLGSSEGVVEVYRCWSLETPMGDHSFSLIGETASPSEIAPATVWDQLDYLRLIEFLEVNSAMVNVRGHVILRSQVRSRQVGRPDGPATYWRCLDLLPMHAFGLARPVNTHGTPQFLIIGRDISLTFPDESVDDSGDWSSKYEKLDVEFKDLKLELAALKNTLGGVNEALTICQTEKAKLVIEIEDRDSANKQLESRVRDLDKASQEAEKLMFDSLEKERDLWALFVAYECLNAWNEDRQAPRDIFLSAFPRNFSTGSAEDQYHRVGSFYCGGKWIIERDGNTIFVSCEKPNLNLRLFRNNGSFCWDGIGVNRLRAYMFGQF